MYRAFGISHSEYRSNSKKDGYNTLMPILFFTMLNKLQKVPQKRPSKFPDSINRVLGQNRNVLITFF